MERQEIIEGHFSFDYALFVMIYRGNSPRAQCLLKKTGTRTLCAVC